MTIVDGIYRYANCSFFSFPAHSCFVLHVTRCFTLVRKSYKSRDLQVYSHRRSQSLPPRLGTKLKLPHQGQLCVLFANPHVHTYRFHSGLGGDIYVHEVMAESKLCFLFPQQLL